MKTTNEYSIGEYFIAVALIMLIFGLIFGVLASANYIFPAYSKNWLGFVQLRPLHVSSIMFFILIGASGCVYSSFNIISPYKINNSLAKLQLGCWILSIIFILFSYFNSKFGGREYWEFPPKYAILIAFTWLLFIINVIRIIRETKEKPVYIWM